MSRIRFPMLLALVGSFALLAVGIACSSNDDKGGKIQITITDTGITVSPNSVVKGPIEFDVKNDGKEKHNLLIIKTNLPADKLPTNADGSVNEGGADVDVQKKIDDVDGGDDTSRTYSLDPGSYVLISNDVTDSNGTKVADYTTGLHATLTVTESESASASAAASSSATATKAASGSATPTASR
ncbi:MAG: hypothetical protein ABI559_04640 [Chloroflexota bacterium]